MGDGFHILVTGVSGFVGQALARLALAKGWRVTGLVRDAALTPRGCGTLVHALGSGAELNLPADVDGVVHLAQSRAYRAFPDDAAEMFRVNVVGTQELLAAAAEAKVSRFCLVSSGTVYEPFAAPLVEDAPLAPSGNLGATKLAAEVLARPYSALFPVSALRLFSPYGPHQTARLIPDLIARIKHGNAVTLPATGGGMLFSPTYVDDVCNVALAAVEEGWGGPINVAAPESFTVESVALAVGAVLGKKPHFERKAISAPCVVPTLEKLGARYDLRRFRRFADGIAVTVAADR